ncbi:flagellar biosynthesis protein FlhB [Acetobacter orientalis]|uniref:EscU/YscU/HrcU family type III secretion system export apparatus switch protein n=1 Tax=Acetobacter orientalis TaxID=146474 RepID=UPI000A380A58|nr:EscU/YscU/HrcU family type III secretion system export apparatus switch protein [Acetobacter orientalis]OUJ16635.1 flagellar biosynthesis protein FlhB [Acetobacter orientalis]
MAEDGSGGGERSQAPTEKRLQTAREEGNIAQSRELGMLLILGIFLLVFSTTTGVSAKRFLLHMRGIMEHFGSTPYDMTVVYDLAKQAFIEGLFLAAPLACTSFAVILTIGFLQTSFLFRPESLAPDISRLSPMRGIKRMFSVNNLVETLKSLVKFTAFGTLLYGVAKKTLAIAPLTERWTIPYLTSQIAGWFIYATLVILALQALIAVLDDLWTRYNRLRGLRMSFQDIKEETKQTDGAPHIKSRQRQIRLKRSRQRMMHDVRKATVVITNPTHYAVALVYDAATDAAPKIVGKGTDELAARIREAASEAKVPVVPNPPLARALYTLPLESEIPAEYFQPVAAVIAYIMKLKTPGSRAS